MIDPIAVLDREADAIITEAAAALERSQQRHYAEAGPQAVRERMQLLLGLVRESVSTHDLVPIVEYSTRLAHERFDAGFDIREVLTAFNVLEETIWGKVLEAVPAAEFANAIGLVGTVFGAGRDALSCTYVSLASKQHVPSLDLSALFRGGR
ncbi:MAG: hypothetical protein Q7V57_10600 [Actinomycetota bacterium]|nr:hypothetical protein [Actinomycetota bacterium]